MKHAMFPILAFIRHFWHARRGATAVIVAMAMPALVGFTGLSIDVGHVLQVKRALQTATDAAALAGAREINCCVSAPGTAVATATSYSAVTGGKNVIAGATVTMASGYPMLKCLTSTGVACGGTNSANAIQVKQQATVPMWFAQIIGVPPMTVSATATAGAAGGTAVPLDVMIIVDTTASMNGADTSCSIAGATRLVCALAGVRTLLNELSPSMDYVGLMVFPGLQNVSQAQYEYDCKTSPQPTIVSYKSSPLYQVLALKNDFKTSNAATSLNTASDLVLAAQGGLAGCTQGLSAVGGFGTYYADAITAAQTALVSEGGATVQKVIILLSDGDASASSSNMPSGKAANQCHEAITAAKAAATAGTWVYAVAYGASTSASPTSCSTDSPAISACSTLQQIASNPKFFYSDTTGGTSACTSAANPVSELVSVFQSIGQSFQSSRLLLDNTT